CDDCEHEWEGDCPVHGPLEIVEDVKVPQNPLDLTRASRTVPKQLCIAQSRIPGAGHGVWTRVPLAKGMRFGPYEGALVEPNNTNGYSWQIRRNRRPSHCVDAMHCGLANWMRYVNCARHEEEQNLMAFQYKGQMYYRTVQDLPPHVELLVWYGDDYGRELGIDVDNFHKPQQMESCRSPIYLEQHLKCCRARNHIYRSETVCQGIKGNHKRTHTGEQPYHHFIRHKRIHTGERPYQCDICDYKATQKVNLIIHKRTHTGERPYQCDICDYKATQKVNLIIHKRTHTGERPYQCDICDYQATIKCNLIIHKRKHSGERPY
ncbi:PR domain zinc finger protein 4, partial [Blattella germanica]